MDQRIFEVGLALGLVAGAALLSSFLRFSVAPFLILAGLAVGPHAPQIGILDFRFIQSSPFIELMGRMGVLFLLFYLGLEFSFGRLLKSGRSIVVGGSIYIAVNFLAGLAYAALMGWPTKEVLIVTGITTISSSAIVAKVLFDLQRTANRETELILGIIMVEDVFLAFYLSIVSGLVLSEATSVGGVLLTALGALGFILGVIVIGRLLVPWLNRGLRIASNESFLLTVFAALFRLAGLGSRLHVAEAIGALLLGLVLAETEHGERIEQVVVPFRDFFGAMFFFGFGLTIDPLTLGGAVWPVAGAVLVTLVGNIFAGMLAGRSAGLSPAASFNVGLTILARGEFSIIMANLAKAGGLLAIIQPFAALYVLTLAILGPLLTKESGRIFNLADAALRQFEKMRARLKKPAATRPAPDEDVPDQVG